MTDRRKPNKISTLMCQKDTKGVAGLDRLRRERELDTSVLGSILMVVSIVPLAFLCHILLNPERLGIAIIHPLVIVDFIIFPMLMSIGLYIHNNPSWGI